MIISLGGGGQEGVKLMTVQDKKKYSTGQIRTKRSTAQDRSGQEGV